MTIEEKINGASVETLKEMAGLLMERLDDGSEIVFDAVINRLEVVMPENEFTQFCEAL